MTRPIVLIIVLIVVAILSLSLVGCGTAEKDPKVLTLAYTKLGEGLDPARQTEIYLQTAMFGILEPLVQYDEETFEPVGGLAESWETGESGKTYVFRLRPDVRFHNGNPLTAEDVKFTYERMLTPDTAFSYLLANVKGAREKLAGKASEVSGIRVVDPLTLEIELAEPMPNFVAVLGSVPLGIVNKQEVEKVGKEFGKSVLSGCGAFRLKSYSADAVVLERNPDYYGRKADVDQVVFRFTKDTQEAWDLFAAGKADIVYFPPDADKLAGDPKYRDKIRFVPNLATQWWAFDLNKEPLKSNKKLRQALHYAIDREELVRNALNDGSAVPATSFVAPFMAGADNKILFTGDRDKAKGLLAEAGYPDGRGLRPLKLHYFERGAQPAVAKELARQWGEIGVRVIAEPLPDDEDEFTAYDPETTDICRQSFGPDYLDIYSYIQPVFHSRGYVNIEHNHYANPEVDALLDKAAKTSSFAERRLLLEEAESLAMRDAPIVPIAWYNLPVAQSPKVKKLPVDPMGYLWLKDAVLGGQ